MFKKFFVASIAFCLLLVQANAATHNNLKTVFDELNYSLTVEWDQKDKAFYNEAQQKFALSVKELQAQGITNQELMDFALSQVKDEKVARDLQTALNMVVINKMSQTEAHKYLTDVMNKSYNNGANWSGGGAVVGLLVLVLIVAVALVVAGEARIEDGCYQVYRCDDYCTAGVCYEDCYYECL